METKHTEGPWEMGQNGCYEAALVARHSGLMVAEAAWDGGSGCHLKIANPADERLIVASPELLAVCIRAAAKFRHYEDLHAAKGSLDGDSKARANAEMAEEIEAVIRKATPPTIERSE